MVDAVRAMVPPPRALPVRKARTSTWPVAGPSASKIQILLTPLPDVDRADSWMVPPPGFCGVQRLEGPDPSHVFHVVAADASDAAKKMERTLTNPNRQRWSLNVQFENQTTIAVTIRC